MKNLKDKYESNLVEETNEYLKFEFELYSDKTTSMLKNVSKHHPTAGIERNKDQNNNTDTIIVYPISDELVKHYNKFKHTIEKELSADFEPKDIEVDKTVDKERYLERAVSDASENIEPMTDDEGEPLIDEETREEEHRMIAEEQLENYYKYLIADCRIVKQLIISDYKNRIDPFYEGASDNVKLEPYLHQEVIDFISDNFSDFKPTVSEQLDDNIRVLSSFDETFGDIIIESDIPTNISFVDDHSYSNHLVDDIDVSSVLIAVESRDDAEILVDKLRSRRSDILSTFIIEIDREPVVVVKNVFESDCDTIGLTDEDNLLRKFDYDVYLTIDSGSSASTGVRFDEVEIEQPYSKIARLYKDGVEIGSFNLRGMDDMNAENLLDEYQRN
jgi:hypothetical protein